MDSESLRTCLLVASATVGAFTDIRSRCIYNWLTFPGIGVGIVLGLWDHGPVGMLASLQAMVASAAPFVLLYSYGAMGGGDVKLMAALWGA